jgi:putative FmdB family regulatory protein
VPIFEYACRACGTQFETLVRNGEQPACAQCASPDLEKKLSVFFAQRAEAPQAAACGTCGDPRGAGSCAIN